MVRQLLLLMIATGKPAGVLRGNLLFALPDYHSNPGAIERPVFFHSSAKLSERHFSFIELPLSRAELQPDGGSQ
ncbi:MAG: hypothetical protein ACRD3E_02200 [Terriglobales bacterium]